MKNCLSDQERCYFRLIAFAARITRAKRITAQMALLLAAQWASVSLLSSRLCAKPNMLVIAVDDLRDYLGCYGREFVHSPNIDRLARRGVLFERAYCQIALCGPSRCSFITGMRPDSLQVFNNQTSFRQHRPQVLSLPEYFKELGYQTQGIGKILHNTQRDPPSWTEPYSYPSDPQYAAPANLGKRALIDGIHPENRNNPLVESADVQDEGYRDGIIADQAELALEKLRDRGEPFLLMVGFHKPHSPFNAPKKYWDLYRRSEIRLAENPFPPRGSPACSTAEVRYLRSFQAIPQEGDFSEELSRKIIHGYLACVSYIDAQIGQLLQRMEELELDRDTIVVLWSDHGYQLGHHGLWCKHSNFEDATRVPLIICDPRLPQSHGKRSQDVVELIDVFPTLADLVGFDVPHQCEGESLLPILTRSGQTGQGGPDQESDCALSQFNKAGYRGRSMRTSNYRITVWTHPSSGETLVELFDHQIDPGENVNVAGEPQNLELVERLRMELDRRFE